MPMQKKRLLTSLISMGLISLLSACSLKAIEFERYFYDVKDNDSHEVIEGDNYLKIADYEPLKFINVSGEEESFNTYLDVYRHQNYLHAMNSTGINKIIVIPIDFNDYPCSNLTNGCKLSRTLIQNAFFGRESRTQYESVASYFDKSSYGKLKVDGFVTDWFRLNLNDSSGNPINYEYLSRKSTKKSIVSDIYKEALNWYQNKYGNLASYYINGNQNQGVPIYFVYSAPNVDASEASDSALWAYTFNTGGVYAWSSFSMFNLNMKNQVDTHTFIHEMGHMLSLADYYASTSSTAYSPTGHVDMMDYSLGDETGYSKMALNWTRPYYVTGSTTIKIKPFYQSGDLILIKNNWNKTAMDEYLLLEYYSPSGLNELDSKNSNPESKLFSKGGIKLYHVDSRVAYFSTSRITPISYVSEGEYKSSTNRIGVAHTNSIVPSHKILKNPLYQLLDKNENISYLDGGYATDASLFYEGDSFGINSYKDYKFHDGSDIGFTFKINSLTSEEAVVEITKA